MSAIVGASGMSAIVSAEGSQERLKRNLGLETYYLRL